MEIGHLDIGEWGVLGVIKKSQKVSSDLPRCPHPSLPHDIYNLSLLVSPGSTSRQL